MYSVLSGVYILNVHKLLKYIINGFFIFLLIMIYFSLNDVYEMQIIQLAETTLKIKQRQTDRTGEDGRSFP